MRPTDPLEHAELTFILGLAFQTVVTEFVANLDAAGYTELRPAHGLVFQALQRRPMTSTELATVLGVTKQAAGQMIIDLEAKGYLRREDHPEGGRRRLIMLTPKAAEHMRVAGQLLHELEVRAAGELGDPELRSLRHGLVRLIRSLGPGELPPLRPMW
jgi:DNA-binding MarR family transcriptional regulator